MGEWVRESFNGKLRDELLDREVFYTLLEVQMLTEQYRQTYNLIGPHSSLGNRPPAPETILPACPAPGMVELTQNLVQQQEAGHLSITLNLFFSGWKRLFVNPMSNPMAIGAAIDRVVHHSAILEFDIPSYRIGVAQQRGQE